MLNPQLNLVRVWPRSAGARSWPQQMSSDHNYRVIYGGTCMCTSMHGGQPINNQLSNTKQTWRTLGPVHTNIHCSCANFSTIKEYSRWVCLSWALLLNFLCSFKLLTGQFSPFFFNVWLCHSYKLICLHLMTKPSFRTTSGVFFNMYDSRWCGIVSSWYTSPLHFYITLYCSNTCSPLIFNTDISLPNHIEARTQK